MTEPFENKTENHDDQFLVTLAEAYYRGIGLKRDYKKAFMLYNKAASMGNAAARRQVGKCYELGKGIRKNLALAFSNYEDASEQGDAAATYKIGDYYWNGIPHLVQKDMLMASDYYIDALHMAEDSNDLWFMPEIYYRVARCLSLGIGTDINLETALDFYNAAREGYLSRIEAGDHDCADELDQAEDELAALKERIQKTL